MDVMLKKRLVPVSLILSLLATALAITVVMALGSSEPVISSISPAEGTAVNSATAAISFSVSDPDLLSGNCYIKVNGSQVTAGITYRGHWEYDTCSGDSYWIIDGYDQATISGTATGLKDGSNEVMVMAADRLGNQVVKAWSFTVSEKPVISGLEPKNGSIVVSTLPVIKAVVTDNTQVDTASIKLTIDSNVVVPEVVYNSTGSTATISYTANQSVCDDTSHTVNLSVSDAAGNTAAASWMFTAMTLGSGGFSNPAPAEGAVVNTALPTISVHLSNAGGTYDISKVTMSVDGGAAFTPAVSGLAPEYKLSYTPATPLTDGTHTVSASVYNKAISGQVNTSWSFKVAVPPTISETSPSAATTSSVPVIAGYARDINSNIASAKITVDGQSYTPQLEYIQTENPNGRASLTRNYARVSYKPAVPLGDGTHNVAMQVYDTAGNASDAQWSFNINTVFGADYPDMAAANNATCWKCHGNATPVAAGQYSSTSGAGQHPEVPACYGCHTKTFWGSSAFRNCINCHYEYVNGSVKYLSYRHTSDGYYGFANLPNVRHQINDIHLSPTTGCEKCHSRILTDEHNRADRTDMYGNTVNCDTCHTGNYLGDEVNTNGALKTEQNQANQTAQTNPWYAPSGRTIVRLFLDQTMTSSEYTELYALYNGRWLYIGSFSGNMAKWVDLPVAVTAVKTEVHPPYAFTATHYWRIDIPKVTLNPVSETYQTIQSAITDKDSSCGSCHTNTNHGPVHDSGLDQNCRTCHNMNLITEHTDNATTAGKNYTCDTCHANPGKQYKRTIASGSLNCAGCHQQGHNVSFADSSPVDIALYPGYRWSMPLEAALFAGEPTTPQGYENGQVIISDRRTDVTVDQVWAFYNEQLPARGWTLSSTAPAAGAQYFVAQFVYGSRGATVKCYNTETASETGQPLEAGYKLEIWYK